jgi:hypothetical protein
VPENIFSRDLPFNDLPLLPPSAELETKAILKKAMYKIR